MKIIFLSIKITTKISTTLDTINLAPRNLPQGSPQPAIHTAFPAQAEFFPPSPAVVRRFLLPFWERSPLFHRPPRKGWAMLTGHNCAFGNGYCKSLLVFFYCNVFTCFFYSVGISRNASWCCRSWPFTCQSLSYYKTLSETVLVKWLDVILSYQSAALYLTQF